MTEEIVKPCPFCGSNDISDGEILSGDVDGNVSVQFVQSECLHCGAIGPRGSLFPGQIDYGCKVAIAAWNQRAGS